MNTVDKQYNIKNIVKHMINNSDLSYIYSNNIEIHKKFIKNNHKKNIKVAISAWNVSHNAVGRAYTLALLYAKKYDTEIIGCLFTNFGKDIWEPINNGMFNIKYIKIDNEFNFIENLISFVSMNYYDIIHLSKPRMPNIILGYLYKIIWGSIVYIDIDDEENYFYSTDKYSSVDSWIMSNGLLPDLVNLYGKSWTNIATACINNFDGITVVNRILQNIYGGTIIRHVRNENEIIFYDRNIQRKKMGISNKSKVILFLGTPRQHKGLLETAHAISKINNNNIVFVIVGKILDDKLKNKLNNTHCNIVYFDNKKISEVQRILCIADCCVIFQNNSPVARYQTPAKLSDAIAAGIPIISSMTDGIKDLNCNDIIYVDNKDQIADAIIKCLSLSNNEKVDLSNKLKLFFLNNLSIKSSQNILSNFLSYELKNKPMNITLFKTLFYKYFPNLFIGENGFKIILKKNVDIIIPVYNSLDKFIQCFLSVYNCSKQKDVNVIIVNDYSDEKTTEYLVKLEKNYKNVFLINNEINIGYTRSINKALSISKSDHILLLNSDTVVFEGWIEGLLKCMYSSKEIGIVGPLSNAALYQTIPYIKFTNVGYEIVNIDKNMTKEDISKIVTYSSNENFPEVYIVNGFCFFMKRVVLESIGFFDELNFPIGYGEEDDFCVRAYLKNIKMAIADNVYVFHHKSSSFGKTRASKLAQDGIINIRKKHGNDIINTINKKMKEHDVLNNIRSYYSNKIQMFNQCKKNEYFNEPKISVIMPIYNNIQYIDEAMTSILYQSLKELEIICINDGSTDTKVMQRLNFYSYIDKRVRVINKLNTGYGSSMNLGIKEAKGEYIAIVESDDYISENMYKELYNYAQYGYDIIKSDLYRFTDDCNKRNVTYWNVAPKEAYRKKIIPRDHIDYLLEVMSGTSCTSIFKRKFLLNNEIYYNESPGASYQDIGFWFKTMYYCNSIFIIDKAYYFYRMDNLASSSLNKDKMAAVINEYNYIYNYFHNKHKDTFFWSLYYRRKIISYMYNFNKQINKINFVNIIRDEFVKDQHDVLFDDKYLTENVKREFYNIIDSYDSIEIQDDSPLVTCIIPIYNAEKYLKETLDSAINQSLSNIEIICVDDFSEDNSREIIKKYANIDCRIKYIFLDKNQGAGHARNAALHIARGEYISFIDSDDYYPSSDVLETLYKKAINTNINIIGGRCLCNINGLVEKHKLEQLNFQSEKTIKFIDWQFDLGYQCFLFKKSIIGNMEFPNFPRFQDPPFFVNCMLKAQTFYVIPMYSYCYRLRNGSLSSPKKVLGLLDGLYELYNISKNNNLFSLQKRIVIDYMNHYSDLFVKNYFKGCDEIFAKLIIFNNHVNYAVLNNINTIKPLDNIMKKLVKNKNI